MTSAPAAIEWEYDIPLLTNRYMLAALAKAMVGGAAICIALVSTPLAMQGEWDAIPDIALLFAMTGAGLLALGLLIMTLFFRNRIRTVFRVDGEGVQLREVDSRARSGNRAALVLGALAGQPGAAGTGVLAISQEHQSLAWTGAFAARFEPATRSIAFRNGWRTLMRIYCLPENYTAVCALVTDRMAHGQAETRIPARSPLGGYLLRTLIAALCCLPLFAMAEEFDLSMFTPLLVLCFAVSMVWLVRPLAWVVLGGLGWMAAELALSLGEERTSMFGGPPYRRYEVQSGDDWAGLAACAFAAAVLAWLSIRILRGRYATALAQDWEDAGEE